MSRHQKTAADYAVIAVCPALIILMITALVHFLVLCLYRGDYSGRLMYILFLFILATTLIARIAIEQGRAYAFGYAAALGLATFVVISQFVVLSGPLAGLSWLFNLLLLALIWWLADRVTFDCTVIDDAERASGEGLVSASGLFGGIGSLGAQRSRTAVPELALDGTTSSDEPSERRSNSRSTVRSGRREGGGQEDANATVEDSRTLPRKQRGHQPGRWVLYLALAALPTFGLGQLLLPDFDAVRSSALRSLGLYLFATLMLLVTTSFLGLRRYLRQRGTEMPADVSVAWLGGGAVLVAAILLLCFALPLPGRLVASLDVPNWIDSPDWLEPSRYGWGGEGAGPPQQTQATATEGETSAASQGQSGEKSGGEQSGGEQSGGEQSGGEQSGGEQSGGEQSGGEQSGGEQSGGEQSGGEQSGGEQSGGEQSGGEQSGGEKSGGEKSGGEQSGGEKSGGEKSGGEQSGGEQSGGEQSGGEQSGGEQSSAQESRASKSGQPSPPFNLPQLGSLLTTLLKLVIVGVLLAVILIFAFQHRDLIRQWWESVLRFLRGERGAEELAEAGEAGVPTKALRSFASFRNPLSDGSDPVAAIIVSFQALEAWGRERGEPRAEGETPSEYVQRARRLFGDAAPAGERLVEAYNRVVYGRGKPTRGDLAAAEKTWQVMNAAAVANLRE